MLFADAGSDVALWTAVSTIGVAFVVQAAMLAKTMMDQRNEASKALFARDAARLDAAAKTETLNRISASAEEAKKVGEEIHVLVNGAMLAQKKTNAAFAVSAYTALKRLAEISQHPSDHEAAEEARKAVDVAKAEYESHKAKVDVAEGGAAESMSANFMETKAQEAKP